MRRAVAAMMIVAILALAWAGGWFWLAGWADRNAAAVFREFAERGIDIECSGRRVIGFPFALRMVCADTAIAERTSGVQARLAGLTGGASVFAPTTAEIALASPAQVQSRFLEGPADVEWEAADVDVGMGLNGPQTLAFSARNVAVMLPLSEIADPRVAAASAAGTLAPSDDGGTDAAVTFVDLAVETEGKVFPKVSGRAAARLSVPPRALLAGRAGVRLPVSARAIDVSLASGDARLDAEGELSLDAQGIVDGSLVLRVAGAEGLPALFATLPPDQQPLANAMAGALFVVGRPTTVDGQPASEISVEIARGVARVGMVEITLPRLRL